MLKDFFIRCDGKFIRVDTGEIRYLEALRNYVQIVTGSRTHMVLMSLRQMEDELPPELFCRVHRSFIVSLNHITAFDGDTVFLKEKSIPISPVYRSILSSRVRVLQSDTRIKASATGTSPS